MVAFLFAIKYNSCYNINIANDKEHTMKLTESQKTNLQVINENVAGSSDNHDEFLDAMETLLNEGIDVPTVLKDVYGTELD